MKENSTEIEKFQINDKATIKEAIKKLNDSGMQFLTVINSSNIVVAVVTDGDFRRAILNGKDLQDNVLLMANSKFVSLNAGCSNKDIQHCFQNSVIEHIPILNRGELVEVISKAEFLYFNYFEEKSAKNSPLSIPVVIMAGGRGERMKPFTQVLPKPLIPIGDKTMIEVIMNEYMKFGVDKFFISVNYKAGLIKAYFEDAETKYNISYISENKPLGTAGALKFLEGIVETPFFVSNCDIIIKEDYTAIYNFHKTGNFVLTLVAAMQHHTVPYGVCEFENGGRLKTLTEKPEYDFFINTGMYLLNPEIIKFIPEDTFFHITHLINFLLENGYHVGVYPVSENSYIDVGQWDVYKKAVNVMENSL
jgi:dTDP-glucose pyrophosphorylase